MCSIVGSFNNSTLEQLVHLNEYRGQMRHSVMTLGSQIQYGEGGLLDYNFEPSSYKIVHHQAPTTQSPQQHPATIGDMRLFHNGIIKDRYLSNLRVEFKTDEQWDTKLLLMKIIQDGFECLKDIDGSFACVLVDVARTYIFRNALAPLFIDDIYNISSTRFDGSRELEPNVVVDLFTGLVIHNFSTNDDVYFYG